jgi:hypothetical protein
LFAETKAAFGRLNVPINHTGVYELLRLKEERERTQAG